MRLGRYAFREHTAIKRGKYDRTRSTYRDLAGSVNCSALCLQRMGKPRVAVHPRGLPRPDGPMSGKPA